ncbi:MAG: hypothetical protein QOK25_2762 [Thermoleophilaceae bacterium]|nr:hypothetical protein [Thermoleophilaceae bacterium]
MTGCGTSGKSNSQPTAATPATQRVASKLVARYERKVTRADLGRTAARRHEGAGQSAPPAGLYRLVIDSGTLSVTDPGGVAVRESLIASDGGDFKPGPYVSADVFCRNSGPGTYRWSLAGSNLALRVTRDRCADRDSILTGVWKKK